MGEGSQEVGLDAVGVEGQGAAARRPSCEPWISLGPNLAEMAGIGSGPRAGLGHDDRQLYKWASDTTV